MTNTLYYGDNLATPRPNAAKSTGYSGEPPRAQANKEKHQEPGI